MNEEEKWSQLGHILSSKYRLRVLKMFEDKVLMPSEIAKSSGIRINHVSNVLKNLKEHGFVKCENPSAKKGRLYSATNKGKEMLEMIKRMEK